MHASERAKLALRDYEKLVAQRRERRNQQLESEGAGGGGGGGAQSRTLHVVRGGAAGSSYSVGGADGRASPTHADDKWSARGASDGAGDDSRGGGSDDSKRYAKGSRQASSSSSSSRANEAGPGPFGWLFGNRRAHAAQRDPTFKLSA